ncbi:hypothetical protein K491DRAFT_688125 [Lophiostoma macrostomum CBS 122681]|uniref:RING-type domain-containing protein n=1 Tax=Lophiostoma macrostomum CBS 122681 TaxID=1314788 RepID=A0A6A6TLQ3_9PLEO|nr:hypothetical protein K491DRAFT_688125 [Lophiostoma macrostomum CBS 122681]
MEGTSPGPNKAAPSTNLVGLSGPIITLWTFQGIEAPGYVRIHEGVLCADARALAFKKILQPGRKAVEGDCLICTEAILPRIESVVWCQRCGQNVHEHCAAEWFKRQKMPSCACCRAKWEPEDPAPKTFAIVTIEESQPPQFQRAAGVYTHYIYTGNLVLNEETLHDPNGGREIYLFELLLLGDVLRDRDFKTAILKMILSTPELDISLGLIRWACKHVPAGNSIYRLMLELFIRIGEMSLLDDCPPQFHQDVLEEPAQEDMKSLKHDLDAFMEKYATDQEAVGFDILPAEAPRKETMVRRQPRQQRPFAADLSFSRLFDQEFGENMYPSVLDDTRGQVASPIPLFGWQQNPAQAQLFSEAATASAVSSLRTRRITFPSRMAARSLSGVGHSASGPPRRAEEPPDEML